MNIFLVGSLGVGKDEVSLCLSNHQRLALGDPIRILAKNLQINGVSAAKLQLSQLFSGTLPHNIDSKLKEFQAIKCNNRKNREILQRLGTYCREHEDDIWIREVMRQIKPRMSYIVTDVRRASEFKAFTEAGFKSVWVEASDEQRIARVIARDGCYDSAWEQSPAELEIKGLKELCEFRIENNGSLHELQLEVDILLAYMEFCESN